MRSLNKINVCGDSVALSLLTARQLDGCTEPSQKTDHTETDKIPLASFIRIPRVE